MTHAYAETEHTLKNKLIDSLSETHLFALLSKHLELPLLVL